MGFGQRRKYRPSAEHAGGMLVRATDTGHAWHVGHRRRPHPGPPRASAARTPRTRRPAPLPARHPASTCSCGTAATPPKPASRSPETPGSSSRGSQASASAGAEEKSRYWQRRVLNRRVFTVRSLTAGCSTGSPAWPWWPMRASCLQGDPGAIRHAAGKARKRFLAVHRNHSHPARPARPSGSTQRAALPGYHRGHRRCRFPSVAVSVGTAPAEDTKGHADGASTPAASAPLPRRVPYTGPGIVWVRGHNKACVTLISEFTRARSPRGCPPPRPVRRCRGHRMW